jgi:uncharacterized LabA/DUF88 family protein
MEVTMQKISIFIDGPNYIMNLKNHGILMNDYEKLFYDILMKTNQCLSQYATNRDEAMRICRVYWYQVGDLDKINTDDPNTVKWLRGKFSYNERAKSFYFYKTASAEELANRDSFNEEKSWTRYLDDLRNWYLEKIQQIERQRHWSNGLMKKIDFVTFSFAGYWKVDVDEFRVFEKMVDTQIVADIISLMNTYDILLLVGGDQDMIPAFREAKRAGKMTGVVDISDSDRKSPSMSAELLSTADFIIRITKEELLAKGIATSD